MISPHAFVPVHFNGTIMLRCDTCARFAADPIHILALAGMETADADRETARQLAEAEELTAAMRQPRASISAKAGRMEREAPLFFGKGQNPLLF